MYGGQRLLKFVTSSMAITFSMEDEVYNASILSLNQVRSVCGRRTVGPQTQTTMLTVPLSENEEFISIDAVIMDPSGGILSSEEHMVTIEYRHYAPRTTVFQGSVASLCDSPIVIGHSESLRGRVGSFSLTTEIQNGPIVVRLVWKTPTADICRHDLKLKGPGVVILPEIFTYE